MYTSFVRRHSGMVCKLLTSKPATAVPILKCVVSRVQKSRKEGTHEQILDKKCQFSGTLDIGKHRARKDNVKLFQTVNQVKQKYNSLRQDC